MSLAHINLSISDIKPIATPKDIHPMITLTILAASALAAWWVRRKRSTATEA